MKYWNLIHAALFYIIWYFAVLAAATPDQEQWALLLQALFVTTCVVVSKHPAKELKVILILSIIGAAIDTIPLLFGFITAPHTNIFLIVYPLWLFGMWLCFSTALSSSLAWMKGRIAIQVFLGALGGPLSLYAGTQIGAITFPKDLWLTIIVYSIEWAIVIPVLFSFQAYVAERRSSAILGV